VIFFNGTTTWEVKPNDFPEGFYVLGEADHSKEPELACSSLK
jgi:hypothetical protein